MLKALPRWPGVSGIISFSMTYVDGMTPSIATLEVVPQKALQLAGTLQISYGATSIVFPDCRVQDVEQAVDEAGRTTWKITIADRRWRWKSSSAISGYYNVRRNAVALLAGTEKTPRELATMLLKAMGETGFDVSALPNDTRPEITWDAASPPEELARLAEALGCRVVLSIATNRVRIVQAGKGAQLPRPFAMEASLGLDPPDPPGTLRFIGARVEFQADFALRAVGRDVDGTVKPIEELSYIPARGWQLSDADHFNDVADLKKRHLARESVWRWYRIEPPFFLPGIAGPIAAREQVLPLLGQQLETYKVDGIERPREPWVYGQFWRGLESHRDEVAAADPDIAGKPKNLYSQGFQVDAETGIVKFSDPVYRLEDAPGVVAGKVILPARIFLRTACQLRPDLATRSWFRFETTRKLATSPALKDWEQIVKREDVVRRLYRSFVAPVGVRDNLAQVEAAAKHYLDAQEAEYRITDLGSVSYAGIFKLDLDGAIRQVTWNIDPEGRAITRASRNREELVVAMSYAERRFYERLAAAAKDAGGDRAKDAKRGRHG